MRRRNAGRAGCRRDLRLVTGNGAISESVRFNEDEPGIFEQLDAAPGQIELKARDMNGSRMALLQFRADVVDDELLSDLERWHARQYVARTFVTSGPSPS